MLLSQLLGRHPPQISNASSAHNLHHCEGHSHLLSEPVPQLDANKRIDTGARQRHRQVGLLVASHHEVEQSGPNLMGQEISCGIGLEQLRRLPTRRQELFQATVCGGAGFDIVPVFYVAVHQQTWALLSARAVHGREEGQL